MWDRPVWRPAPVSLIPAGLLSLAVYGAAAVSIWFLVSCSSSPTAVPTTPRETLFAAEVSYTAAANEANSVVPLLNAPQKAALLKAYSDAGQALNAAEAALQNSPPGTGVPAVDQADALVRTLIAVLAQAKATPHG